MDQIWDKRYANFCAKRGFPRFDWLVDSREEAISMLGPEFGEEFAKQYPEDN
jgi:hypothetical protein